MIGAILTVLLGESFTALGQVLLKVNTNNLDAPPPSNIASYLVFAQKVLHSPGIWLGLFLMAVGLFIWLIALSWFDLSLVFPISSVQYILVLAASRIFLHEKINMKKLMGTFLVIAGITMIAFT